MSYFPDHYYDIKYKIRDSENAGLHTAQLGAIHAISSIDTLGRKKQIITMPTGSGKTAVLMMTPFILRAARALVLTPSRIVADQIAEEFESLVTLKRIGVLAENLTNPIVAKQRKRVVSLDEWSQLKESDIVVSTPQCISPEYKDVAAPPNDIFDIILVDEAHHSPARTWNAILNIFPDAKHILFTATPFRRDKKEIQGHFSYSYPLSKAYDDGIYGEIKYIPVEIKEKSTSNTDVFIAKKAEEVFTQDKEAGYHHYLMVRTDSRSRAEELEKVYTENTKLRLQKIFGSHTLRHVKKVIADLEAGNLDGIIAVDMMGEGFNLPNLKIAAIHSPHKSLEVTLQFIGRFTRVTGENIGLASFVATPNEIEIEGEQLFNTGAVWQKMIPNLSSFRIDEEIENKGIIQSFNEIPELTDIDLKDLSLYSLSPRLHVKVYRTSEEIDISKNIEMPDDFQVLYINESEELSARIWVLGKITTPKWSNSDKIFDQKTYLAIAYADNENKLLYLAFSDTIDSLYESIARQYSNTSRGLPSNILQRVYRDLNDINFFNVGMRNARPVNESYRILTGSKASEAIDPNDKLLFTRGHVFGSASDGNRSITLGVSSSSKIWSSSGATLPKLIKWCKSISTKMCTPGEVYTNTGLDNLSTPEVVSEIPTNIIAAQWPYDIYKETSLHSLKFEKNGIIMEIPLLDIEIKVLNVSPNEINLMLESEYFNFSVSFSLENFYVCPEKDSYQVSSDDSTVDVDIEEFLNHHYLLFYTSDHSVFFGNEISQTSSEYPIIDLSCLNEVDWGGTDITSEVADSEQGESIHKHVQSMLNGKDNKILIFDHRKGEIADFIEISYSDDNSILISFYHCKKSNGSTPGIREEDFTELCPQAIRNSYWVKPKQLRDRLLQRIDEGSTFIKGNKALLEEVFEEMKNRKTQYQIFLVQPGLSKRRVESMKGTKNAVISNLSATRFLLMKSAGFTSFRILCSE